MTVGIGFLGTGRVAEKHATALAQVRGAKLAGAWNRTAGKAADFCGRHGCRQYETVEALLADTAIDAVVVLTNTASHLSLAKRAMEAGKHVLLEKPLCETADEIAELIRISKTTGRICMPSHNYIYDEQMRRIHAHLKAGHLGTPVSFWAMFNNRHDADCGTPDLVMRELMVHHAYAMLYYLGRPEAVVATATNVHFTDKAAHDQIMISATFANGAIANLWGSFSVDDRSREPWSVSFRLFGTEGTATASWDQIKFGPEPEPLWDDAGYLDSFLHVYRFFVEDCVGLGAPPLSRLEDAYDAAIILRTARQSLSEGRRMDVRYDGSL